MDFGLQALAEAMWVAYCAPTHFQQLHPHINLEPVTLESLSRAFNVDMDQVRLIPFEPIFRTLDGLVKQNWGTLRQTAVLVEVLECIGVKRQAATFKPPEPCEVPVDAIQRTGFCPTDSQLQLLVTPILTVAKLLRFMDRVHYIMDIQPKQLLEDTKKFENVRNHPEGFRRVAQLEQANLEQATDPLFNHRKLPCTGILPDGRKCNRSCVRNKLYCSHCLQTLGPEATERPATLQLRALKGPFVMVAKNIKFPLPIQPGEGSIRSPLNFTTLESDINNQIEVRIVISQQTVCITAQLILMTNHSC